MESRHYSNNVLPMEVTLWFVGSLIVWHLYVLAGMARYCDTSYETLWPVPRSMLTSRFHWRGLACVVAAMLTIVLSELAGLVGYGIILATLFMIGDTLLVYNACREINRQNANRRTCGKRTNVSTRTSTIQAMQPTGSPRRKSRRSATPR